MVENEGEDCACGGDCACGDGGGHAHGHDHDHGHAAPEGEEPDPQLDPTRSPGYGTDHRGFEDIEVSRDVVIGTATPAELTASDTEPYADDAVESLLDDLIEGGSVERRRAALALGERESSPRVVEALTAVARADEDDDVRQFAVESLAALGGDRAADAILVAAREDADPWVRAEAVISLDRLDREGYADALWDALDDDHHAVRRNAMVSMFKLRGEGATDVLLAGLSDPSERVREWAAHMLGGVDDDRAREALAARAESDGSEIVRLTARNALAADPARFRRRFQGAAGRDVTLPGEDLLNRTPDL